MKKRGELIQVPIEFERDGKPRDPSLYAMVMQYCEQELAEKPDLTRYRKAYAVAEVGEHEEILGIHGITAERSVEDIGIFRATGPYAKRVTKMMHDRWQAYFADNGMRGADVLIWIDPDESPEAKCTNQAQSIKNFKLRPAKRMLVRVK